MKNEIDPIIHNGLGWASDGSKLIYLGIPKAASCSMRDIVETKKYGATNVINFYEIPEDKKDYRKFTVIREPFQRFTSAVYESLKRPETVQKIKKLNVIKNVPNLIDAYLTILETDGFIETHTAPQVAFLKDKNGGFFEMDKILIFEDLTEDFNSMCKEFGINKILGNKNIGNKTKASAALRFVLDDPKLKERVENLYKEDFEFYNKIKNDKK